MTSTGKAQAVDVIGTRLARRVARWIGAKQQAISDHAHASADARARARGWTVTASTGRFGFGARTYRDPRFAVRQHQHRPGRAVPPAESRATASPQARPPAPQSPGRHHDDL
jgi:Ni/Co efflux regulator RcnB